MSARSDARTSIERASRIAQTIPPAWYAVLDEADVPRAGRMRRLKRFDLELVVWRSRAGVNVHLDVCPRGGARLSRGTVVGDRLRCGCHGMEFAADGACLRMPALARPQCTFDLSSLRTFPVRIAHGLLWLWWGDDPASNELPFFPQIAEEPKLTQGWAIHYPVSFVRVVESYFDLYHLDHLHSWPLRMGKVITESRVQVDGPFIRAENEYIDRLTGRSKANRSTVLFPGLSLQEGGRDFSLKFLMAASPIDAHTTWFFVRHYYAPFRIPLLGPLLNTINNLNSVYRVMPEDVDVQSGQRPADSGIGADQLILPADRCVIEYWRMLRQAQPATQAQEIQV